MIVTDTLAPKPIGTGIRCKTCGVETEERFGCAVCPTCEQRVDPTATVDELPIVTCPRCGDEQADHDGFGFVSCAACGFCVHLSRTGGTCDICGDVESTQGDTA